MKKFIYIETSVISYLTAKPTNNIIMLAHQKITKAWWKKSSIKYKLYISEIVYEEVSSGDYKAAEKRIKLIDDLPQLELNKKIEKMTEIYIKQLKIPKTSLRDAAHLAVASIHNIDYLVTWNCKHIANGEIIKKLIQVNKMYKIHTPIICTPEELLEV